MSRPSLHSRAAAVRIADDLEITANQQTEVMGRVKNIARETAYIEALKEFFETMLSIQKKIDNLTQPSAKQPPAAATPAPTTPVAKAIDTSVPAAETPPLREAAEQALKQLKSRSLPG